MSPLAASRMASGFPAVSVTSRSMTVRVVNRLDSSAAEAVAVNPDRRNSLIPTNSGAVSPSRRAKRNTTASCRIRRAANSSTVWDSRSIHCRSSITTRIGRSCEASDKRVTVAAPMRNGPLGDPPADQPIAISSAARCGGGICDSRSRRGVMISARLA